ncbi:NAD-dependent epimerase/dehydratase family protein [Cognatiyoonia sp. IB215182]|uniref:NAD-dependent epimerase/dehydratase family protein n=1 Tax=Cognatiyoonia sp. IB215182 TaxID=3097353 RepID=UPI002A0B8C01|nr:NAD-dependent epimerase/dehydratase family protein [Cognatiyoonia sp. IB215182]MDX8354560.1 NAD-dependent epimerase/dehydratase family protein [Cognatiyoonia sp. IB215182]
MRILIVGGTGFLGKASSNAAIAAGHEVTVMTRSGAHVANGAATLIADREEPLPDLRGQFDAVIDTCAYAPDMVERLAAAIGAVHYVLVSSISVYDDMSTPQFDETAHAPTATEDDLALAARAEPSLRATAEPYGASYGRLKRACEIAAHAAFAGQCTHIRLGLIVGPRDYTDRFTWWVRRCDQEGPLVVPGPATRNIQIIDVRDAGAFLVKTAEERVCDTFHLTGQPITLQSMLDAIITATGRKIDITYRPLAQFAEHGIRHWTDLPLIVPDNPAFAEMLNVSTEKAQRAELTIRPLAETVQAVLAHDRADRNRPLICGMSADQEAAVRP